MSGRTSAPYAPPVRPCPRPSGRASAARGVVAAVIAASGLLLAANVGPAGAADTPQAPASVVRQTGG
ncbi:hypothetical protein OG399_18135 [Streptomyces achromogenes]|uniref:Uncharacterized protein n=1 Tax=Streptomyces achromogenes TaxID=67255 RepID=A0ABZ1KQY5_STRAH|nr:hypothetical protein [Streptomyces sp. UMAF16]